MHNDLSAMAATPVYARRLGVGPVRLPLWFLGGIVVLVLAASGIAIVRHSSDSSSSATTTAASSSDVNQLILAGVRAQNAGDLVTAAKDYSQAIAVQPTNARAHYDLGTVFQSQANSAGAIGEFEAAIRFDASNSDAYYNLGILYTATDKTRALAYYEQAIKTAPASVLAHRNLGFLLRDLGQTAEGDAEIALSQKLATAASTATTVAK